MPYELILFSINSTEGGHMASTEAQKRASVKWTRNNIKSVSIGLRIGEDDDIIKKLESVPNKQQYLKKLIRDDI